MDIRKIRYLVAVGTSKNGSKFQTVSKIKPIKGFSGLELSASVYARIQNIWAKHGECLPCFFGYAHKPSSLLSFADPSSLDCELRMGRCSLDFTAGRLSVVFVPVK